MRRLLDFFIANKHWFLLIFLLLISMLLLLSDGLYRRGLRMYVQSYVSGHINEAMTQAHSYMALREKNENLLIEKARLEHELIALRRKVSDAMAEGKLGSLRADTTIVDSLYVTARIVNANARLGDTYYMINKGRRDGLRPDMPVVGATGVVGTVMEVSEHYAIVIPIISAKLRLSCAVLTKGYQGQLSAQGLGKPAILGGIPLHADIAVGDTIVTSSYSYIFPEGLIVGTVERSDTTGVRGAEAAFGTYRIKLATDFERLSYVYILLAPAPTEAINLEQSILPNE